MDDLLGTFEQFISAAKNNASNNGKKISLSKWKHCVALTKLGWKAYSCERIEDQEKDDIIIKWKKEGNKDIIITLTFTEQCLWLEYLCKEKNKK